MLHAYQLSKRYRQITALDRLDLTVARGEIFCLLGANGAGKTTTINLFLGFIKPDSGHASIDGMNVAQHARRTKALLAYIPEQVQLYGGLTGLENLDYFCALAGHVEYNRGDYLEFLDRVGLEQKVADRRLSTYSKGMRQKVGIAIALAKRAKALLLDEPTSGLDPAAASEFGELLGQLRNDGTAVLMATHDLFRAAEIGTHVGIMKHGRLVETVPTSGPGHLDLEKIYLEHMRA
ncbi:MAG: ABC transporter ATP-binding protein [Proteobacteria bacterium]|nr:ABC transporter ATP-binding protein [Pseudomonadota bacterium]